MVISHSHRFIFIKTVKTAGTSIEVYLSRHCGAEDVFSPIVPPVEGHEPRNSRGLFNPLPELVEARSESNSYITEITNTAKNLALRKKYFPHMAAWKARARIGAKTWNSYYKFCVERNPWDKTLSHFHMLRHRTGGELTLDEYLGNGRYCVNYPKYTDRHGLIVDRVILYDQLYQSLGEVFDEVGIPYEGSLDVNAKGGYRSDRSHYRDVLSEQQAERIAEIYAEEIKLHGFTY